MAFYHCCVFFFLLTCLQLFLDDKKIVIIFFQEKGTSTPISATWPHRQSTFVDLSENTAFAVLSV